MQRITLKEIAQLAGVSRGTVDRVLHNRGRVSHDTAQKIKDIAVQLGYVKNEAAAALAKNKVAKIATIIPQGSPSSFWQLPIEGIRSEIDRFKDFGLSHEEYLFDSEDADSFSKAVQSAISYRPDAYILAPLFTKESHRLIQVAQQNGTPVYTINTELAKQKDIYYIGQDSFGAGKLAGRLFYQSNPSINKVVCITPQRSHESGLHVEEKIAGITYFFKQAEHPIQIENIIIHDYLSGEAYQSLIDQLEDSSIGLFFTNARAHYFFNLYKIIKPASTLVIGFDLVPNNILQLEIGNIDFILNQNPLLQGELAVRFLADNLLSDAIISQTTYLPCDIIVKENYAYYMSRNEI